MKINLNYSAYQNYSANSQPQAQPQAKPAFGVWRAPKGFSVNSLSEVIKPEEKGLIEKIIAKMKVNRQACVSCKSNLLEVADQPNGSGICFPYYVSDFFEKDVFRQGRERDLLPESIAKYSQDIGIPTITEESLERYSPVARQHIFAGLRAYNIERQAVKEKWGF
jgi:hypothetical protein